MITARPRILIKVTFLKHFALEVWVSIIKNTKSKCPKICLLLLFCTPSEGPEVLYPKLTAPASNRIHKRFAIGG